MNTGGDPRPLVAHLMHRLDIGGLENGVVNLINHLDARYYRHAVIALTDISEYKQRIQCSDVQFVALSKPPGHSINIYPKLYRVFREMRPDIVHTRNLAALEATVPAWAAGVPVRIHGEHGRDVGDFDGSSRKYRWIRRLYRPFVTHYVAVSRDLDAYLTTRVGVPSASVTQIYNGVDAQRFKPTNERPLIQGWPFGSEPVWVVGYVGRMEIVKDPLTLVRAFARALDIDPAQRKRLRLVMVGDGALRAEAQALLSEAGLANLAWLPGARDDIPAFLRSFDCFVLPSLGEGISNTILEAMASGLPVIATDVGGNAELVELRTTGELVAAADSEAMAQKIVDYARNPEEARRAGHNGRMRVERLFSLDAMVHRYQQLYDEHLAVATHELRPSRSFKQIL